MLGFITDMINLYGKDIKSIIKKESVDKMLSLLKEYKIKKYENFVQTTEEVNLKLNV